MGTPRKEQTMDASLKNLSTPIDRKEGGKGKAYQFTPEELIDFLDGGGLPLRDRVLFWLAYFTGSRISEVLALNWGSIQVDEVHFPPEAAKTKIRRRVKLSEPDMVAMLAELKASLTPAQQAPGEPVFLNKHGNRLLIRGAHFNLNKYASEWSPRGEAHGISTHSFRRTFVRNATKAGHTPKDIANITGHKLKDVLSQYT